MKRIALLSNVNLDFVIKSLKYKYEVFESAGYGTWATYAIDPNSSLVEFEPHTIFLVLDGNAMFSHALTLEQKRAILLQNIEYVDAMLLLHTNAMLFVSSIDIRSDVVFAADEMQHGHLLMWEWEQLLDSRIKSNVHIHRFDLRSLINEHGKLAMYSAKMWYMGGIPFDLKGMRLIAQEIDFCIEQLDASRKKVLVLDLDNTLWGGIVGEDGYDKIVLGPSHIGAIYQDVQRIVKQMISYGVLLAVISKNNIDDVNEVFDKNPHMMLQSSDFVEIYANWEEKPVNLRLLAQKLNLGLDSFVFVDDNVVERESVRLQLPEVTVPDFPTDIAVLPLMFANLYKQYFWVWQLTNEDKSRTTFYQDAVARGNAYTQTKSMDEYLRSLETVIQISLIQPKHFDRVHQLLNKTNQFNTNTIRMDMVQLTKYVEDPRNRVFVVNVRDKFGDAGLVAVLMIHLDDRNAVIDNFLMSCRVMGRHIEHAVVAHIINYLITAGITSVYASYVPTAKNKPVAAIWNFLGFDAIDGHDAEYRYMWQGLQYETPSIHTVCWE